MKDNIKEIIGWTTDLDVKFLNTIIYYYVKYGNDS